MSYVKVKYDGVTALSSDRVYSCGEIFLVSVQNGQSLPKGNTVMGVYHQGQDDQSIEILPAGSWEPVLD